MNNIELIGIEPRPNDERICLLLTVRYQDDVYNWSIMMPAYHTGTYQEFITANASSVYSDIQTKLDQWNNLPSKTKSIRISETDVIEVPIEKSDIVKPTYPDYYMLRKNSYPSIAEQLDAIWKGGESADSMKQLIAAIKTQHPK